MTVNNTDESFTELLHKYPEMSFHFNDINLGFDRNVYQAISKSQSDYIHILSDNDYRSHQYWKSLFKQLEAVGVNSQSHSTLPLMFLPITKKLDKSLDSYPCWYAAGISELLSTAENESIIQCKEDDPILAAILQATSQISHIIVQRNSLVQQFIAHLVTAEDNHDLVKTGLPQSIYTIQLMNVNFEEFNEVSFKPFFTPCLLAFMPETHRSVWFYDSTFIGQKILYTIGREKLLLPTGVKDLCKPIIEYLQQVGIDLIATERVFHKETDTKRWAQSLPSNSYQVKHFQNSVRYSIVKKIRKYSLLYFKKIPMFLIRYFFIIATLKVHHYTLKIARTWK